MSVTTTLFGTIPAVIGGPEETIEGTDAGEWIFGTIGDDNILALGGDDLIQGFEEPDTIDAGDGNDTVLAGPGADLVEGGQGNDVLRGDEDPDDFRFDTSRQEGADTIVDFTVQAGFLSDDILTFSAVGLVRSGVAIENLSGAGLDARDDFDILPQNEEGAMIVHPGGTITLSGVTLPDSITFQQLQEAPEGFLGFAGLLQGNDEANLIGGGIEDNVIDARAGNDLIQDLGGDDIIATGPGRDAVALNPSNPNEGDDIITDFSVPIPLDPTVGDILAFRLPEVLAADPNLPAANGDADTLSLADFDASPNWTFSSSAAGNLLFTHPGGTVEFTNAAFANQQFANLGQVIAIDGNLFLAPIPVTPPGDDEEPPDGEEEQEEIAEAGLFDDGAIG